MSVVTRASPRLLALGWRATFEDALALLGPGLVPARVALAQRGHYHLLGEEGGFPGEIAGRFRHQQGGAMAWPAVGDWVAAAPNEGGPAVVEHVLPRHTALVRGKSSRKNESAAEPQLLVANVDVVAIVTSMNDDFRERRLERYLAVVRASGASALLVLTKRDLTTEADDYEARARAVAGSAPVVSVSATQADGVEAVRAHLVAGRTLAFVGSSGVGKSTLVNALAGQELRATGAIRESDGRGRHVTTHRELLLLPEGGVLVDTPGLRELALWAGDEEETEDAGFEDIDALAAGCRFRDCGHTQEPGCAVKLAVTTGVLSAERLESHHKLEKELAKRREERGARAALAEKRAGKAAVKSVRAMGKRK